MAEFPITYSKATISGQGPAVPISFDVDTGGQAIAQSVMQFGETLQGIADNIYKQEAVAELSEGKRKIEESLIAAFNSVSGDEEADAALWAKAQEDIGKIQYKKPAVNAALTQYLNQILPDQKDTFDKQHLAIRKREAHDKFVAEGENFLAQGNFLNYYKLLNQRLATKDISKAEFDSLTKNAPNDSILQQMRYNIGKGRSDIAIVAAELLKNPTNDQMDYRDKLLTRANKDVDDEIEKYNQQYWQLLQKGDIDAIEQSLNDPNNPLPVTKDGGKNWWRKLIKSREQDLAQTDLQEQSKVIDAIIFAPNTINPKAIRNKAGLGIHGGLSLDKVQEYEKKYELILDKNSALNTPMAKTFFNELKNAQTDRAFSIDKIQNNERYGQSLDSLTDYFINYREKNGKDPSLNEAQEYYQNLISGYRTPERPFTDAKIQQTLGELESGGSVTIFGRVIEFGNDEDAINHMLRNLGPNWQQIAPEAAEIIKRKWPQSNIKQKEIVVKEQFQVGEIVTMPDGRRYEYKPSGVNDKQPFKLVR